MPTTYVQGRHLSAPRLPEEIAARQLAEEKRDEEREYVGPEGGEQPAHLTERAPEQQGGRKEVTSSWEGGDQGQLRAQEESGREPELGKSGNEAEIRIGNISVSIKFPEHLLKQS